MVYDLLKSTYHQTLLLSFYPHYLPPIWKIEGYLLAFAFPSTALDGGVDPFH